MLSDSESISFIKMKIRHHLLNMCWHLLTGILKTFFEACKEALELSWVLKWTTKTQEITFSLGKKIFYLFSSPQTVSTICERRQKLSCKLRSEQGSVTSLYDNKIEI